MLRVILLERKESFFTKHQNTDASSLTTDGNSKWITIGGRYNSITTYHWPRESSKENDELSIFSILQDHNRSMARNCSNDKYTYPLFLISSQNDTYFWNLDYYPYMCVVRIHFSSSINNVDQHHILKQNIRKSLKQCKNIRWMLYNTIELSDAVLVLRSKHFSDLIKYALNLEGNTVGKTYTYFGIQLDHILNKCYTNDDEEIPLFSIQFSASNNESISEMKTEFDEIFHSAFSKKYKVSGIDDYAFVAHNVPLENVERYYDRLLTELDKKYPCLLNATTKLGVDYKNSTNTETDSSILEQSKKILCEFQKIRITEAYQKAIRDDINSDIMQDIDKALSELTVSLPRIASTLMLDEFVYLMIESVDAFLKILKQLLLQNQFSTASNIEKYQYFIEKWIHLMEHVTRAEGQLHHHPEMRPLLYDMPIIMLEYTLAFLTQCTKCFNAVDDNSGTERTCFLLIPCLCTRIEARELFNIKGIPSLVIINIPFYMLYRPKEMLRILCHEIAHFAGESTRMRDRRIEFYSKSMASLMQLNVFEVENIDVFNVLQNKITHHLKQKSENCSGLYTMQKMQQDIFSWIEENIISRENLSYDELVLSFYYETMKSDEASIVPLRINSYDENDVKNNYSNKFIRSCKNISILFRETYADVCMIKTLNLSATDYINMHTAEYQMLISTYNVQNLNDETQILDRQKKFKLIQQLLAAKIAICLRVCNLISPNMFKVDNEILSSLVKAVLDFSYFLTCHYSQQPVSEKLQKACLPRGYTCYSFMNIETYLKECYYSFENTINAAEVQTMYNKNYSCDEYSEILKAIDLYRSQLISNLEENK